MNGREYATSYNDPVDNWRHLSRPRRCRSHRTKVLLRKWEFRLIPYAMDDTEKEFIRARDAAMERILGSAIPSMPLSHTAVEIEQRREEKLRQFGIGL